MTTDLFNSAPTRTAVLSPCKLYRYRLDRWLGPGDRAINFVMVNPSTADHETDDNTILKCQRYARSLGFDHLIVTNIFGLRSTHPVGLARGADPVGPDNDFHVIEAARSANLVIAAWGAQTKIPKAWRHRPAAVLRLLIDAGAVPHALKLIGDGDPGHPLFLPADLTPFPIGGDS